MDEHCCKVYTQILRQELVVAMGCTEPIAIAYAGALARKVLGAEPDHVEIACSGNIIKNVKGVTVPKSGGMRGIEIAALLGVVGGDPDRKLAVLESVTDENRARAKQLLEEGICHTSLLEGEENLDIVLTVRKGGDRALAEIRGTHSNVTRLEKNGRVLVAKEWVGNDQTLDKKLLNVQDILTYGETVDLDEIRDVLERQAEYNRAISEKGLCHAYGARVGTTLEEMYGNSLLPMRAAAAAAAGSDARMGGCAMPVVINSGSGNQGLTITMPVLVYAEALGADEDRTLRALAIANLLSIHQKKYIGSLSAYCGASSAACAACAAVCWLRGGTREQIVGVITNTLGTIGGMLCDGAKSSCAAKIAAAVSCGLLSMEMSMHGRCFQPGEGLIARDVESTIRDIGEVAREGMHTADVKVLHLMLADH